jgi:uncharacterized protein YacL
VDFGTFGVIIIGIIVALLAVKILSLLAFPIIVTLLIIAAYQIGRKRA